MELQKNEKEEQEQLEHGEFCFCDECIEYRVEKFVYWQTELEKREA